MIDPLTAAFVAASGFGAGVMNALAGGGTILTFPALRLLGLPAIEANATSTVALVPGAAASLWGYRREVATHRPWLRTLLLPSILGGALGSWLLLETEEKVFAALAPWLVLFATLLFLLQIVRSRGTAAPSASGGAQAASHEIVTDPSAVPASRYARSWIAQFAVAVYGGYFGAGIGILMLVVLGFLGLTDILAMNGLKNFFGMTINGVACAYFIAKDVVVWPVALVTMAGAIAGGFAGARFARHVGREKARWAVVAVGLTVTAVMLWQQAR